MKYFKNTELAKLYNVSEKSVRNWIDSAKQGKLDLQLYEDKGKFFIANTLKNAPELERLVSKGKKYRNSRGFKAIVPNEKFYQTYNQGDLLDIISSLTIHKEIPLQYGYLDGGAESWDKYANRLASEEAPNILTNTTGLFNLSAEYINQLLGNRKVNIIDLGPGNGLPAKPILENLLEQGKLNRYIAIDMSQDMLNILESNIKRWFDNKVRYEGYIRNFSEERFNDLITESYVEGDDAPVNLVLLFGGTLSNFRLPDYALRVINSSMGSRDLLLCSGYTDTPHTRRFFDLSGVSQDQKDPQQSGLIPSLLQIDESVCEFQHLFDEGKRCRFKIMRPKVDLQVRFKLDGRDTSIELAKDERITLWRHQHYDLISAMQLFDKNDFNVFQASKSEDKNYFFIITGIKTGSLN